jgi:hypothetical protein
VRFLAPPPPLFLSCFIAFLSSSSLISHPDRLVVSFLYANLTHAIILFLLPSPFPSPPSPLPYLSLSHPTFPPLRQALPAHPLAPRPKGLHPLLWRLRMEDPPGPARRVGREPRWRRRGRPGRGRVGRWCQCRGWGVGLKRRKPLLVRWVRMG